MELGVKKRPQNAVLFFLSVLDFHIVVNPHDALFRRNRQCAECAVLLIIAEINRHVIRFGCGKFEPRHQLHNRAKRNDAEIIRKRLVCRHRNAANGSRQRKC